jgi:hypothetical protein
MKSKTFAAAVASLAVLSAGAAKAGVIVSFSGGDYSPTAGYTVIDPFNDATGITGVAGTDYVIQAINNSQGAPPANSVPQGTDYLSVLGNGSVTISFAALTSSTVSSFEFDWGSLDGYNTLTIYSTDGTVISIPGTTFLNTAADGNQTAPGTNGLFKVVGTAGTTFTGMKLASDQNSFEVDNLAIGGIPEPTTWAMMLVGLGGLGVALRARRKSADALA